MNNLTEDSAQNYILSTFAMRPSTLSKTIDQICHEVGITSKYKIGFMSAVANRMVRKQFGRVDLEVKEYVFAKQEAKYYWIPNNTKA